MTRVFILVLFLWGCPNFARAQSKFEAGKSYFGQKNYIEYIAGNSPLIISAPHGGSLKPNDIPDRLCDGCSYIMDANTQELARAIQTSVFQQWGCYPHIIINRLHRVKLDANRDVGEAANSDPQGIVAWNEYHNFIDSAKAKLTKQFGKGLFIDLHGHGHTIQRLELGYLLTKSELQKSDVALNENTILQYSSIKSLVANNLEKESHAKLIRGDWGFGTILAKKGYPAVPSQQDPFPNSADDYFNGGYNTKRHGSNKEGTIDAIQIECNMNGVRDNANNRQKFADSLVNSVQKFMETYYFKPFPACNIIAQNDVINPEVPQYSIFPQPSCNTIKFNPAITEVCEATICDLQGRAIYQDKIADNQLQMPDSLEDGSYLLQIKIKTKIIFFGTFSKKCL